ncbi:putative scaffold protein [Streptococcus phage P738]|nr:putative scaffold protein [Streptococcus phage P738]
MEEENKNVEASTEEVESKAKEAEGAKKEATEKGKQEKTFNRDELAKIMAAEKEKWKAELEAEKTQAEKLAKMNAEEKIAFERDQLKAELEELRQEKAKSEMTKTARGMLAEADINISEDLLATLVTEEAEVTKTNVDSFIKSFKEEVDKAVKEALKGKVAKKPASPAGLTKEAILSVKDRSERLRLIAENQGLFN